MKIMYKQPWWLQYNWILEDNPDEQYVNDYSKEHNKELFDCFHDEYYSITVEFNLLENVFTDKIFCIWSKPGKNMGITYHTDSGLLALEFWANDGGDDEFYWAQFHGVTQEILTNSAIITVKRVGNIFELYSNFQKVNEIEFRGQLIEDYRKVGLVIGAGNPFTYMENHKYFGYFEIKFLSFLKNDYSIESIKEVYQMDVEHLPSIKSYNDILYLFDFQYKNKYNIVYDNSSNYNFFEKIPTKLFIE